MLFYHPPLLCETVAQLSLRCLVLSFSFNFLTQLDNAAADFAFVFIDNSLTGLFVIGPGMLANPIGSNFSFHSGVQNYSQVITNTGTSTLAIGVVNVGDEGFQSALLVDNIQISTSTVAAPQVFALLGISFLFLAVRKRVASIG